MASTSITLALAGWFCYFLGCWTGVNMERHRKNLALISETHKKED